MPTNGEYLAKNGGVPLRAQFLPPPLRNGPDAGGPEIALLTRPPRRALATGNMPPNNPNNSINCVCNLIIISKVS
jgi:hypothetical protein